MPKRGLRRLATWQTIQRYAANPWLPLSLSHICCESGISARALHDACYANTGQSPIAYIRGCHMALAHEMLSRASPRATVAGIATFCGFNSFGRFAVAYRRRYGQVPSETLRQSVRSTMVTARERNISTVSDVIGQAVVTQTGK